MQEEFTFQFFGCWKVDCLIAEIARLTGIVKGMDDQRDGWNMTKETDGIESDDVRDVGRSNAAIGRMGKVDY